VSPRAPSAASVARRTEAGPGEVEAEEEVEVEEVEEEEKRLGRWSTA